MREDDEPPAGREEFLRYLADHGVILVASRLDDDGMTLVTHTRADGDEVNPYFSTVGSVRRWIQLQRLTEVTPYPSLRMEASWLVGTGTRGYPSVLFDPGSPWEREVTEDDIAALRALVDRR
jgi:hypothetical protein